MRAAAILRDGNVVGALAREQPRRDIVVIRHDILGRDDPRRNRALELADMGNRRRARIAKQPRPFQRHVIHLAHVGAIGPDQVEMRARRDPLAAQIRLGRHGRGGDDFGPCDRLGQIAREKALTRQRDEVAAARRALPWVRLDTDYVLDTTDGPRRLSDLFEGRRQLLVQHFMLGPGWEQGCRSCSFMADHLDGIAVHLAQRDIAWLAVSRAPIEEIERFRHRMGWRFRWASSHGSPFNHDFGVSFPPESRIDGCVEYNYHRIAFPADEAPGLSAFVRDDAGTVFHTYSTYGRGVEAMMGAYALMDLTAMGRGEDPDRPMDWIRHHDRYEAAAPAPAPAPAPTPASCDACDRASA